MKKSLFEDFVHILQKASCGIRSSIKDLFESKTNLSQEDFEELEKILLKADFGVSTSIELVNKLKISSKSKIDPILALESLVYEILAPCEQPLNITQGKTNAVLICGTNGSGKTTTIGKLSSRFCSSYKVLVAACDTFRSAAIEQLQIISANAGADFFCDEKTKDPASVAYMALEKAQKENYDLVLIDTSGRMSNNTNLMQELQKISKVVQSNLNNSTLKHNILILDSSVGQNAFNQIEVFSKSLKITGLILTKLDGSAKAGAIVGIANKHKLPIHFTTMGEKMSDLASFEAESFAKALFSEVNILKTPN